MPTLTIATDQAAREGFIEHYFTVDVDQGVGALNQLNNTVGYIGVTEIDGSTHMIRKTDIHKVTLS